MILEIGAVLNPLATIDKCHSAAEDGYCAPLRNTFIFVVAPF